METNQEVPPQEEVEGRTPKKKLLSVFWVITKIIVGIIIFLIGFGFGVFSAPTETVDEGPVVVTKIKTGAELTWLKHSLDTVELHNNRVRGIEKQLGIDLSELYSTEETLAAPELGYELKDQDLTFTTQIADSIGTISVYKIFNQEGDSNDCNNNLPGYCFYILYDTADQEILLTYGFSSLDQPGFDHLTEEFAVFSSGYGEANGYCGVAGKHIQTAFLFKEKQIVEKETYSFYSNCPEGFDEAADPEQAKAYSKENGEYRLEYSSSKYAIKDVETDTWVPIPNFEMLESMFNLEKTPTE